MGFWSDPLPFTAVAVDDSRPLSLEMRSMTSIRHEGYGSAFTDEAGIFLKVFSRSFDERSFEWTKEADGERVRRKNVTAGRHVS